MNLQSSEQGQRDIIQGLDDQALQAVHRIRQPTEQPDAPGADAYRDDRDTTFQRLKQLCTMAARTRS